MKAMSRSILVAAVASFVAGIAAGLAVPVVVIALFGQDNPSAQFGDEPFVSRFAADYDLSAKQRKLLRMILKTRHDETDAILMRNRKSLPKNVHDSLQNIERQAEARTRVMLNKTQLERYLRDLGQGSNR